MKIKFTIFFLFLFSTIHGQNIVVDITDKSQESKDNSAHEFVVIEPKLDTLNLSKLKTFSIVIGHKGEINSIHIIDYPNETFADLHNIEAPETDEEYNALSNEEWAKFNVILPKHEIIKEVFLSQKLLMELKIISEQITHTEIYLDGKLIKTLYYQIE